jgi:hypothetical protein
MGGREIWKIRGMEGMEGRRKRGFEDGNNAGKKEKTDIKYGRMSRRMIWKLGGMEGRRKRGMEDGRKGRTRGREEYKVWKNGRKRDMEDKKDGRKQEERD